MATVTLGQAVRDAITSERAAARFYDRLAREAARDQETRDFFVALAGIEGEHAAALEGFGERLETDEELPQRAGDRVALVEVAPEWLLAGSRGRRIALGHAVELAIEQEACANRYYDALAAGGQGPVREFFRALARAEVGHGQELEELRAALPEEDWAELEVGEEAELEVGEEDEVDEAEAAEVEEMWEAIESAPVDDAVHEIDDLDNDELAAAVDDLLREVEAEGGAADDAEDRKG